MKNYVEEDIKKALMELCTKKDFDSISVREIYGLCQISKQTFYNHFKDKYDIVEKIYLEDMAYDEFHAETYNTHLLNKFISNLWEHRDFYRNVLVSSKQNSLAQFAQQNEIDNMTQFLAVRNIPINNFMQTRIIYNSYGFINTVHQWVLGKIDMTVEELCTFLTDNSPDFIRSYWENI